MRYKRLGYVHNPRSLMKGMETLCCDEIGDLLGSQSSLTLRENANEYWLVDFAENESQATSDGSRL